MAAKLGFIGTGRITTALVEGLCTTQDPPAIVLVSPRNAENAARLAARFSRVSVAANNQAVVESCDCVFLAVLPQVASTVLSGLPYRPDQTIVSLIAIKPIDEVRQLVKPAKRVFRAVPLPSVAKHLGPVVLHPDDRQVMEIFSKVGKAIAVPGEKDLSILWALTALIAPFYALVEATAQWAAAAGVDRQIAGTYTASMFHAMSALAADVSDGDFSELLTEAMTPGGLNEQALAEIRRKGGYRAVLDALDSILLRLGERPAERE
jgi:pyrroline-5-carboxylate reductase